MGKYRFVSFMNYLLYAIVNIAFEISKAIVSAIVPEMVISKSKTLFAVSLPAVATGLKAWLYDLFSRQRVDPSFT